MKFYWNENYPSNIYCLGVKTLYVLNTNESVNPETGLVEGPFAWTWQRTTWNTTPKFLKQMGFEFIGKL